MTEIAVYCNGQYVRHIPRDTDPMHVATRARLNLEHVTRVAKKTRAGVEGWDVTGVEWKSVTRRERKYKESGSWAAHRPYERKKKNAKLRSLARRAKAGGVVTHEERMQVLQAEEKRRRRAEKQLGKRKVVAPPKVKPMEMVQIERKQMKDGKKSPKRKATKVGNVRRERSDSAEA